MLPPDSVVAMWGLLALACLVGIVVGVRAEGRWFAERGKERSWRMLRICSIPIFISSAGLIVLVTRSIGGPAALMALYVMLFTVAPAVYFLQHWIAGRWLKPPLSVGESAWIGFSGLLIVTGPPALISATNPWVHSAARLLEILF
jgi:hypothetical protein